jgi:hypothetical protein
MLETKNQTKPVSTSMLKHGYHWTSQNQSDDQLTSILFDDGHAEYHCTLEETNLQNCQMDC